MPAERESIDGSTNGGSVVKRASNLQVGVTEEDRLDSPYFGSRLSNGADGEEELASRAPTARSSSIYFAGEFHLSVF